MICSVPDCAAPVKTRGFCSSHYMRWWRYGDPLVVRRDSTPTGAPCRVAGCERPGRKRGLCSMHYGRLRVHGRVGAVEPERIRGDLIGRIASKIEFAENGCWRWLGAHVDGYGTIRHDHRNRVAHRVAYEALVGVIPDGLQLDHLCRTRDCVNPDHLEPVTASENTTRMWAARHADVVLP